MNLSGTLYSYEKVQKGSDRGFTAKELEEAAISLCNALVGKYRDLDGQMKKVGGDMTKIRYVEGLSPAAKRLVQNTLTHQRIVCDMEFQSLLLGLPTKSIPQSCCVCQERDLVILRY